MSALTYEDVWEGVPDSRQDRATAALVTSVVAFATGVPAREIAAPTRARAPAAQARQIAMYLAHVVHCIEDMRDDPEFDAKLSAMEACLRQAPEPWGLAA